MIDAGEIVARFNYAPLPSHALDCDFAAYPNVKRRLGNVQKLKSWNEVNEVFNGFTAANKGKEFVRV
jgi:hypothetical protein